MTSKGKSYDLEVSTSMEEPIHCAATPEGALDRQEQVEIDINNFLNVLAEVALVIACRRRQQPM